MIERFQRYIHVHTWSNSLAPVSSSIYKAISHSEFTTQISSFLHSSLLCSECMSHSLRLFITVYEPRNILMTYRMVYLPRILLDFECFGDAPHFYIEYISLSRPRPTFCSCHYPLALSFSIPLLLQHLLRQA